ncbi:hypothetical protein MRB53_002067 [Persea americana]|uniref:Uncharacterized protein n=1 Tax=Persea americana TaxID=3435 RepID=A0ACC2MTK7_PERAE|nr:hypothetical protein MRB53_002067 [Persea americana]
MDDRIPPGNYFQYCPSVLHSSPHNPIRPSLASVDRERLHVPRNGLFLVTHILHCQCGCSHIIGSSQKKTGRLLLLFSRQPAYQSFDISNIIFYEMHKTHEKGRKRNGFGFALSGKPSRTWRKNGT